VSGVFISYRRDDCPGHAGRLYDRLADRLGEERVFMDIDAIEPGVDFGERIEEAVGSCDVLLALVGSQWLDARDESGRRRLDDPADLVRVELAAGLARSGLRVIPVLVEGASMPGADALPDDLKPLARRNASELSDARWRYDVGRLADVVDRITRPAATTPRAGRSRKVVWISAAAVLAVAVVVAAVALHSGDGEPGAAAPIVGPVGLGREAGRLTFGWGSVWVPVASKQAVARVDPDTLKVRWIRRVGGYPSSAAAGEGGVWVADSEKNTVIPIDPRTDTQSAPIAVGVQPNDVAVGEGFVWTANCDCTDPDGEFSVSRIDPRTHEVKPIDLPDAPIGVGTGDGNVWVTRGDAGKVQRIDPRGAQTVGAPIKVGTGTFPTDVAVDRSGIWVTLEGANAVVRIDPDTFAPGQPIAVGKSPHILALGGGFLWVAHEDGTVWRIDTSHRRVVGRPVSAGPKTGGVAFGAARTWIVDEGSGELRGVAP
jgi:YVTN family beta-propeller protein